MLDFTREDNLLEENLLLQRAYLYKNGGIY